MTSTEEMEAVVRSSDRADRRITNFLALLSKESSSWVIVVGGSAITVLSEGRYVSSDIDIRVGPPGVDRVLKRWGFTKEGRHYFRDDLGLFIDIVGTEYTGDPYRAQELMTPYGAVSVAAVEDLIVKRLAAAKHWPGPEAREEIEQARTLWLLYEEELDTPYLERVAEEYDVLDLLHDALKKPTH